MKPVILLLRTAGVFLVASALIILLGGIMRGLAPGSTESGGFGILMIATVIGGFALYFLPSIVSARRGHRDHGLIVLVNLALGWTIVCWVVCLIWATRPPPEPARIYEPSIDAKDQYCRSCGTGMGSDAKFCPRCGVPVGATAPVG